MTDQKQSLTGLEIIDRIARTALHRDPDEHRGRNHGTVRIIVLATLDAIRDPSEEIIGDITPWHQARDRTRETIQRYIDALRREIAG